MNICALNNLKDFKVNPNWARVGILGYYKYNKKIYLLMGRYKVSDNLEQLCAISGGFKRTKEQIEEGAQREFTEETEQFFGKYSEEIKKDMLKAEILFSTGKNGIDRILFLLDISKYVNGLPITSLKEMFKEHFETRKNTELAGIDLIEIDKIVNDYCDTEIYSDFINFMKKNKIYRNNNLQNLINKTYSPRVKY
jgi:hypothetical protein|tara:strand:- start:238 stop:822 length:585 start_codon:yes stop_codon:yes gene_type:complete